MTPQFIFQRDCEAAIMDALECCDNMVISFQSARLKDNLITALRLVKHIQEES